MILRYEIERALINGDIEVDDIPALWNEKMQAWLGLSTIGNYRNGCMQDIHWTDGGFGYFPSYTLGAMYAAQLFSAANRALPDLNQSIAQGEFGPRLTGYVRTSGSMAAVSPLNSLLPRPPESRLAAVISAPTWKPAICNHIP